MRCFVEYAACCQRGKVRVINQDNFWCLGRFLEAQNHGLETSLHHSADIEGIPVFAVFDGMGGEKYGETAAYLAAETFNDYHGGASKNDINRFLAEACEKMNAEICLYAKSKRTGHMGTTAAMLTFDGKHAYVCNIGDSRVYRHSGGKLTQISLDHLSKVSSGKKPPLTQHLGIPPANFVIEPYIAKSEYKFGDRYLICSDGLTDMVADSEIERLLSMNKTVLECAETLTIAALSNGGADNITVILCEVKKK